MRTVPFLFLLSMGVLSGCQTCRPASSLSEPTRSGVVADARAREIAERVLERLGGEAAWNRTHYVTWNFFGKRRHVWDKWTGDLRTETGDRVTLINLNSGQGRVFDGGTELAAGAELDQTLEQAREIWINDAYWMFMPYKLLDPGVHLAYAGEEPLAADGRAADVLVMTFDAVGVTPKNRYRVSVARDTDLVEQWSFFEDAGDREPKFTRPWSGWKRFGDIWLCTGHGKGEDWEIAVFQELPRTVFESPEPAALPAH